MIQVYCGRGEPAVWCVPVQVGMLPRRVRLLEAKRDNDDLPVLRVKEEPAPAVSEARNAVVWIGAYHQPGVEDRARWRSVVIMHGVTLEDGGRAAQRQDVVDLVGRTARWHGGGRGGIVRLDARVGLRRELAQLVASIDPVEVGADHRQGISLRRVRRGCAGVRCPVLLTPDDDVLIEAVAEEGHLLVWVFCRVLVEAIEDTGGKGRRVQVLGCERSVDPFEDRGVASPSPPPPNEDRVTVGVLPLKEGSDR